MTDDELIAALRHFGVYAPTDAIYAQFDDCVDAIADRIEALTAELAEMKFERLARSAIDPITRLHNLCDALAEDRGTSPYSQEAWDAQDEAYREKCAELAQAVAAEREACAKVCEDEAKAYGGIAEGPITTDAGQMLHQAMAASASNCAAAIRARKDELSGKPPVISFGF